MINVVSPYQHLVLNLCGLLTSFVILCEPFLHLLLLLVGSDARSLFELK